MDITTGRINKAVKVLIYGPEGIGKTTFASHFPEPLFIDTEGSTVHMDVHRLPKPEAWGELIDEVNWVLANPTSCKTLVIDTADWAEALCNECVCARDKKAGIEDYGYGKGYVYAMEEFQRLPTLLQQLVDTGIHVVITAHAQMRKFEQPDELGAYDRWEMKLSKKIGPLLREWSDMVLFANYKTLVVNVDGQGAQKGKNKAQGGKRVMYTTHHPCWDAKNRFGLAEELDFSYEAIKGVIEGAHLSGASRQLSPSEGRAKKDSATAASTSGSALARKVEQAAKAKPAPAPAPAEAPRRWPALPVSLERMITEANVTPDEVRYVIAQKGIYPADTPWGVICADTNFMTGWLMHPQVWPQVVAAVMSNRADEEAPF